MRRTQYLLRFDDICPTMNWQRWAEIESVLVQRRIKPILAVVPDNHDPALQVDPPFGGFWDRVRIWQQRGWTIALHGYQHRYVTRNAGIVALRRKSEFAGLPIEDQREKLRRGLEIFQREGIASKVWIAPGNTFDSTTVALLQEAGIRVICDGYFRSPFVTSPQIPPSGCATATLSPALDGGEGSRRHRMIWVPQQLFTFRPAPPGVWTVCYHHNQWSPAQMKQFRDDLDDYGANIVSLDDIIGENAIPVRKWSSWLCMQPRLSRFLIRAELKLWSWCCQGPKRSQRTEMKAVQLSR